MAITPYGFDGTLDESKWAQMWQASTTANHVLNPNDFRVTAVGGYRQVAVASGTAFSRGVLAVNDAVVNLTLDAPTAGQWWLIALRVDWNQNTATPVALPGVTTTTANPASLPSSFPTGFSTNTGVAAHMPLAWAWTTNASTALTIVDVRTRNPQYINQGIWGPYGSIPSGPPGARDLWYGVATNNASVAGQNYLQGALWFNTDSDRAERFYGLYDATANPGGATAPGWYPAFPADQPTSTRAIAAGSTIQDVRVNPGSTGTIASWTVTVPIATRVQVQYTGGMAFSTGANINTAANLELFADGVSLGGARRWHSNGTTGNTIYQMSQSAIAMLTPGTHTLTVRLYVESPSSSAVTGIVSNIAAWEV